MTYSIKRQTGNLAEEIAARYLEKRGYKIVARNYLRKWGELDLIAKRGEVLRFIEVKSSVSHENDYIDVSQVVSRSANEWNTQEYDISRESMDSYRPEENLHYWKQKRMMRAIQSYIFDVKVADEQEWQIDLIIVKLDFSKKEAIINHIENIVFEAA